MKRIKMVERMWTEEVEVNMTTMRGLTDMDPRKIPTSTRMRDSMGVKRIEAITRGKVVVAEAEAKGRTEVDVMVAVATVTETITIRIGAITIIETITRMVAMGVTMGAATTTRGEIMIDEAIEIRMAPEKTSKMTDTSNVGEAVETISSTTRKTRSTTSLTTGCTMRKTPPSLQK